MAQGIPLSEDELAETILAYQKEGSKRGAARSLGISPKSVRERLAIAARSGLLGTKPVLPGFEISRISTTQDEAGNVTKTHIQQKPERELSKFNLPINHQIKGVSAFLDADGNVQAQWVKTRHAEDRAALSQSIRDAFDSYVAPVVLPLSNVVANTDLLTIYPIADLHLGLFSWAKETGTDYDLKIASDLLKSSMADLVARAANSERAIVLDLGDYLHGDNSRNQTSRSGNPLDIDSRYSKVIQVGVELAVHCIDLALQKHKYVIYRKLPGNHDEETSLMLAIALAAWFRDNERVSVDTNPSRFFMHQHGLCMIAATHGDMLKMGDMAGYMAAQWPKEWGTTEYRHAYTGHIHNEKVRTGSGVRVESFNTLAAKDAWHSGMGYTAPRSMVAITLHKERGETDRLTVTVPR